MIWIVVAIKLPLKGVETERSFFGPFETKEKADKYKLICHENKYGAYSIMLEKPVIE